MSDNDPETRTIPTAIRPLPRAQQVPARSHVVDTAAIVCLALVCCVALVAKNETIAAVALTSILPVVGLRKSSDPTKPQGPASGALTMLAAFGVGVLALAALLSGRRA